MTRPIDFFSRVDKNGPNGCWIWAGPKNKDGYGVCSVKHRSSKAHRVAYEMLKGPIPERLQIDHICRNRACVNPDHMEVVTKKENTLRSLAPTAINARKTHCYRGHLFDEKNTYISPEGHRYCKACRKLKWQRKVARRKALLESQNAS